MLPQDRTHVPQRSPGREVNAPYRKPLDGPGEQVQGARITELVVTRPVSGAVVLVSWSSDRKFLTRYGRC